MTPIPSRKAQKHSQTPPRQNWPNHALRQHERGGHAPLDAASLRLRALRAGSAAEKWVMPTEALGSATEAPSPMARRAQRVRQRMDSPMGTLHAVARRPQNDSSHPWFWQILSESPCHHFAFPRLGLWSLTGHFSHGSFQARLRKIRNFFA